MEKLEKLKNEFDLELKKLANRDQDFRSDYIVYFKDEVFEKEILNNMNYKDKKQFGAGAGSELNDYKKDGKMVPSKIKSVASSSRFCYLSLKDTDFKVFKTKSDKFKRIFEEKLPVVRGTPPHMDCYYESNDELIFFECKCHEFFDNHDIILSKSYFNDDRIVTRIDDKYIKEKIIKNREGKEYYYNEINPEFIGLYDNPRFDIKQFLTHIMGIQKRLKESKKDNARLIYYYFIPDNALNNKDIKDTVDKLYEEIKNVFNSDFIKNIENIQFELYVQYSDTPESANRDNTRRVL